MDKKGKMNWKAGAMRLAVALSVLGVLSFFAIPAATPASAGDDKDPPFGDCPGNIVPDEEVNVLDLLAVLATWGECPIDEFCPTDLDGNETINVNDLLIVLGNWGECPEE